MKHMGQIILYHGSKSGIKGEIKPISRELCDFGSGFYIVTNRMLKLTIVILPNS